MKASLGKLLSNNISNNSDLFRRKQNHHDWNRVGDWSQGLDPMKFGSQQRRVCSSLSWPTIKEDEGADLVGAREAAGSDDDQVSIRWPNTLVTTLSNY